VELSPGTGIAYLRHAFGQMLSIVDTLGEPLINQRPTSSGTNAVGALVLHCCAVCEYWLGHVALGRPSDRDRASEFSREPTAAECHEGVARTLRRAESDLGRLYDGAGAPNENRRHLPGGAGDDDTVLLHVLEEVFQHLGQMELTRDLLLHP
jgi:Protein of unknown function (DUF664)